MKKLNIKKVATLGLCCAVISSAGVSAMSRDVLIDRESPTIGIETGIDYELSQKHREIDQYVFVTHAKEIADAGFTVTHTGPRENYIEIGILPYSGENANLLYEVFGREEVKVVEGVQAVTLPLPINDPDGLPYENRIIQEDKGIQVQVNGQQLQLDTKPFIQESRTLIPLRGVMEELGAKVEWFGDRQAIEVSTDGISIQLVIGEDTVKVKRSYDGTQQEETIKLEVPAILKEGRTFILGRFVAETLGANVVWDQSLQIMSIETEDYRIEDEIGESLEEMDKALDFETVKEMKLFSLMGEELKTFTADEVKEIINQLNTSPTYTGAYIMMLAGNNIQITFENGDTLQLTSYGFEEHVIMGGEVNGEFMSYAIISPEVGGILLDK